MSERDYAELGRGSGAATVYEGGGRGAASSTPTLHQVVPGSRVAGPARIARCAQDDNLMVHAAMAALQPGEVLVLTMPEPAPVALLGDLLATQAQVHGAAAVLVDAAVRDVEELAELGLPIWARWVRVRGAVKDDAGRARRARRRSAARRSAPATRRARRRRRRRASRPSASTRCSRARSSARRRSASSAPSSQAGALSYDLDGLRAKVEGAAR